MLEKKGKCVLSPPSGANDWWMINNQAANAMTAVVSVQSTFPDAEAVVRFAWDKIPSTGVS